MQQRIVSIGGAGYRRLCSIAAHADVSDLTYIAIYIFVGFLWRVVAILAIPFGRRPPAPSTDELRSEDADDCDALLVPFSRRDWRQNVQALAATIPLAVVLCVIFTLIVLFR